MIDVMIKLNDVKEIIVQVVYYFHPIYVQRFDKQPMLYKNIDFGFEQLTVIFLL